MKEVNDLKVAISAQEIINLNLQLQESIRTLVDIKKTLTPWDEKLGAILAFSVYQKADNCLRIIEEFKIKREI